MPLMPPGPFTVQQARAAGLPQRVLHGPAYRQLVHGVYAPAEVPATTAVRAEAALLVGPPGAIVARHTAARLWGGVVPTSGEVHLVIPTGSRMRVAGVDARVRAGATGVIRAGLPVTTARQTFLDLAADLGLVDLVVLGDSLVRAGALTLADLQAAQGGAGRHRHLVCRAARLVRAGVDSPMETRLRLLLVLAGLPEPVVNVAVRDQGGRVVYRLDLGYPEVKVAVEYDGRQHAQDSAQWRWDVRRREDLESDGWRLIVVLATHLYREPAQTLGRVVGALRERGMRVAAPSDGWRDAFLGRAD